MRRQRQSKSKTHDAQPPHPSVNDIEKSNAIKFEPRRPNQRFYWNAIHKNAMTFGLGPAGTGKTYVAVCAGLRMLLRGEVSKFILVRPAVAAGGEEHGFLPGDLSKKLAPWARPAVDLMKKLAGGEKIEALLKDGKIEAMPFTYMRGLTFEDAFVLLDEAQNCTLVQMKLFTTRLGENVRVVIDGDIAQSDLDGHEGLSTTFDIAEERQMPVGLVEFTTDDVVRSEQTKMWVEAWEAEDARND